MERNRVARAASYSAQRFRAMTGRRAEYGTIVLNSELRPPLVARMLSRWTLPYYRVGQTSLPEGKKALGEARPGIEAEQAVTVLAREVLSHEICHKFVHAHARGRSIPMAFEEVISVGCERPDLRKNRINNKYTYSFYNSWSKFLTSDHPMNERKSPFRKPSISGYDVLYIEHGSDFGNHVMEYYYRSALFGSFLEEKCKKTFPLGIILDRVDQNFDFAAWLASRREPCLGYSERSFSRDVTTYAETH